MNYGDIIEYTDCTLDKNFDNARHWAEEHETTFEELVDKRNLPKRYFQIGPEPVKPVPPPEPPIPEPTEDDLKASVRMVRDMYLIRTDFTQLEDVPMDEEEKGYYREYRQYLRDYTSKNNWWLKEPDAYDQWLLAHHPVEAS